MLVGGALRFLKYHHLGFLGALHVEIYPALTALSSGALLEKSSCCIVFRNLTFFDEKNHEEIFKGFFNARGGDPYDF